jgi:23S rRNA (cytosine1962-C5)-methyltransferase
VLKLYTAAWLPRLNQVVDLIRSAPVASSWRERTASAVARESDSAEDSRLRQGAALVLRLSRNIQDAARQKFNLADGQWLIEDSGGTSRTFLENGLRFEADVVRGQKTGFFLDQRENRRRVEALARERDVLNAFSFSGGFSLYSARGGAKSVTDLDISSHALESAKGNFALNKSNSNAASCRHEAIRTDAFAWLEQETWREFDLVILDPPSLAKREAERAGAVQAYGKLAANALRRLRNGGVLVAASCSAHVSAEEFFDVVQKSAQKSGRRVVEMETTGQPPDHPATFPEAQYLKCIYLRIRNGA